MPRRIQVLGAAALVLALGAALIARGSGAKANVVPALIPAPVTLQAKSGSYALTSDTRIVAAGAAAPVGAYLHALLSRATALPLPVRPSGSGILLQIGGPSTIGDEG